MSSAETTQPIAYGRCPVTFHIGDRVTNLIPVDGTLRRYAGKVIDSNAWVFRVAWDGGHGVTTYTHGNEPELLRPATDRDIREAAHADQRQAIATYLRRLAAHETTWPGEVRRSLQARAVELLGGQA